MSLDPPPPPPPTPPTPDAGAARALAAALHGGALFVAMKATILVRYGVDRPGLALEALCPELLVTGGLVIVILSRAARGRVGRLGTGLAVAIPCLAAANFVLLAALLHSAIVPRLDHLNLAIAELLLPSALSLAAANAGLLVLLLAAAAGLAWALLAAARRLLVRPGATRVLRVLAGAALLAGTAGTVRALVSPAYGPALLGPLAGVVVQAARVGRGTPVVPLEGAPPYLPPRPAGLLPEYAGLPARARGMDVLVIVGESLTAVDLRPWGGPVAAPTLERWLERGVRFDRCYAHDNHSNQGLAALLLGIHPLPLAVTDPRLLAWRGPALARGFAAAGYGTFLLWSANPDGEGSRELAAGCDDFDRLVFQPELDPTFRAGHDGHLVQAFERLLDGLRPDQPFLGVVWTTGTHSPYTWWTYEGAPEPPGAPQDDRGRYRASIARLDEHLAGLERALDRRGRLDRTLLVLVGDHGEGFGVGHELNVGHGMCFYENNVRIPFVIASPRVFDRPLVDRRLVQLKDVGATLHQLALGAGPALNDGLSALEGRHPEPAAAFTNHVGWGLARGRWKLQSLAGLLGPDHRQLFDLEADPAEARDLAGARPEVVAELEAAFRAWYAHAYRSW